MDITDDEDEDNEEQFLRIFQHIIETSRAEEEEDDRDDDIAAVVGLIAFGVEEANRLRAQRRYERRLYLTRPDLIHDPRGETAWQVLYRGRNDRAFITTMSFDCRTFDQILQAGFTELWETTPIARNDVSQNSTARIHRRSLDAAGALGLILHFLNTTMVDTSLCEIFAIIPTTVSRYLAFSLKILLVTLKIMPDAQITWPSGDQFQEFNALIVRRHPLLLGAFGSVDGLNLPVQTSTNEEEQNATFNGWLHDHFVSSVLAFGSDGTVIGCKLNAPGSWHDSRVARPIFLKLQHNTPDDYYLVADTAFPRGTDRIDGKIKAPIKEGERLPANLADRQDLKDFDRQLLSYRQTAEWGNRNLQGTFGRLRVPLPISYASHRADILETCIRLFNLRTRTIGRNQTRTVYKDVWDGEAELWFTFESMLFAEQRNNDRVRKFHRIDYALP